MEVSGTKNSFDQVISCKFLEQKYVNQSWCKARVDLGKYVDGELISAQGQWKNCVWLGENQSSILECFICQFKIRFFVPNKYYSTISQSKRKLLELPCQFNEPLVFWNVLNHS